MCLLLAELMELEFRKANAERDLPIMFTIPVNQLVIITQSPDILSLSTKPCCLITTEANVILAFYYSDLLSRVSESWVYATDCPMLLIAII